MVKAIRGSHVGIAEHLEPRLGQSGAGCSITTCRCCGAPAGHCSARRVFHREHGRDPNPDEEPRLADQIQQHLGQRSVDRDEAAGNYTDEALVYLAVEHALTTGKQTLVLTRDADVEEQFFKLLWLIDTHYRGMLLADRYVERFSSYRTYPVPDEMLQDPPGRLSPRCAHSRTRS